MNPRFTGICLITDDVASLAGFYAALLDRPVTGDARFAMVSALGATLSIFSVDGMEQMAPRSMVDAGRGAVTIEWEVDDVDSWFLRLRAAGTAIVKPPTTQPWGRRSVWLRDPDGNIINLFQRVPDGPDPETVVRTYLHRLLVQRDLSVCDEMLADNYVDHDAPPGTEPGPQATRAYVAEMLSACPDLRFSIDQLVVQDQTVAVRATWNGGPYPAGSPWRQTGLLLIRLDDSGRIVERHSTYDNIG